MPSFLAQTGNFRETFNALLVEIEQFNYVTRVEKRVFGPFWVIYQKLGDLI